MNHQHLTNQYSSAKKQRNFLFALCISLCVTTVALSGVIANQSREVVLVPTRVTDGMVAFGNKDTRYMEAITLDAIYALLNISPGTFDYSKQVLMRVTTAASKADILRAFDESTKDYQKRNISTSFIPTSIEYQIHLDRVEVTGLLRTLIGSTLVSSETRTYRVSFEPEAGSYRVSGIREVISQDDT